MSVIARVISKHIVHEKLLMPEANSLRHVGLDSNGL